MSQSSNPYDNTILYGKGIPRTMPMLPKDPRNARVEFLVTYRGHKQSRGIELRLPPEEIRALIQRMDRFLVEEASFYNRKADIDRRSAVM